MASPDAPFGPPRSLPELPERTPDPAQASLVRALRSSFAVLRLAMLVLVVLYIFSGVFPIEPGDQGVIVRLGDLVTNEAEGPYKGTKIFGEGWRLALPDPFDEKIRIPGRNYELETDAFLFERDADEIANKTDIASLRRSGRSLRPGLDGAMLTGDKNLSHGLWRVEYRLANAEKFIRTIGERPQAAEPILRRLFEHAITREVAYRKVEEVTRTKRDIVAEAVRKRLQKELDALEAGIDVLKVNANTIVPPQVAPAFDEVTRAENERKRQEDAAYQTATEILNQAAGPQHVVLLERIRQYGAAQALGTDPQRMAQLRAEIDALLPGCQGAVAARLREAEAAANAIREQLLREFQEFLYWREQYRLYPRQTLIKLWTRMRQEILDSKDNEIFWVPDSDVIEIIVNRDPNRALELERERLRKQIEGSP